MTPSHTTNVQVLVLILSPRSKYKGQYSPSLSWKHSGLYLLFCICFPLYFVEFKFDCFPQIMDCGLSWAELKVWMILIRLSKAFDGLDFLTPLWLWYHNRNFNSNQKFLLIFLLRQQLLILTGQILFNLTRPGLKLNKKIIRAGYETIWPPNQQSQSRPTRQVRPVCKNHPRVECLAAWQLRAGVSHERFGASVVNYDYVLCRFSLIGFLHFCDWICCASLVMSGEQIYLN